MKFSCSIALKTDLSSSVRSNSCDILGDVTTSLCQVISALATLVMSMEPTCQQSTLTLREHKFQDMLEITNPELHKKTTSRPTRYKRAPPRIGSPSAQVGKYPNFIELNHLYTTQLTVVILQLSVV